MRRVHASLLRRNLRLTMYSIATVLNVHADVLPIHLAINKICCQAALRFATLPKTHLLHRHVKSAIKRHPKKFPSPLHRLMAAFPYRPDSIETIQAVRLHPKWQRGFSARIAPDKKSAIEEDINDKAQVKLYSDGSGIDGSIGASAVLLHYHPQGGVTKRTLRYRLGSDKKHDVYEGEVVGMLLASHLLLTEQHLTQVSLSVDNQAAIRGTDSIKPASGHYLMDMLHKKYVKVKKRRRRLKLMVRYLGTKELRVMRWRMRKQRRRLERMSVQTMNYQRSCARDAFSLQARQCSRCDSNRSLGGRLPPSYVHPHTMH